MPRRTLVVLLIAATLGAPALAAETGTLLERRIERLVAMPTPLGPVLIAGDQAAWRVDVPTGVVVFVEARGNATAPFALRAQREGAAESAAVFPTTHAGFLLSTPGAWRVSVDPIGGVAVNIRIVFMGAVGGQGGAPATFTLTDLGAQRGCVVPGVCLP